MTFSRVSGNPNSVLPNAASGDRALDDQGYLWLHSTTLIAAETLETAPRRGPKKWRIERRIKTPKGNLLDVQGEPTLHQGVDNDVAVSARGTCWIKKAGAWQYEDDLGDVCERSVKTAALVVLGNLSLPIVDGKIPIYHPVRTTQIVGYLKVEPIN